MLKRQITYNDLDDRSVTEEYWFGLNKAELAEMELSGSNGSLTDYFKTIVEAKDGRAMVNTFKEIILSTVGVRSEDGKRFVKTDEIRENFELGGAYPELFMELVTDPDKAAEFFNGIMPKDLAEKVAAQQAAEQSKSVEELLAMDQADFDRIAGTNPQEMSKEHLMVAFQRKNKTQAA